MLHEKHEIEGKVIKIHDLLRRRNPGTSPGSTKQVISGPTGKKFQYRDFSFFYNKTLLCDFDPPPFQDRFGLWQIHDCFDHFRIPPKSR